MIRQLTVATWDAGSGGTAVCDDGTRVQLAADALTGSVFRLLRPGQRLDVTLDGDRVTRLGLPGTLTPADS